MSVRVTLSIVLITLLAACTKSPSPPGYDGPVPSAKGQMVLRELQGRSFVDETGALGGGSWTIGPFGVIPNPVTGKGPVVLISKAGEQRHLPVETLADVSDLHRRATGETSPLLRDERGELGADY